MQDQHHQERAHRIIEQHPRSPSPLAFVFASDPQYPWTERTDAGLAETDEAQQIRSRDLISEQYTSIARLRAQEGGIEQVPLMINGDMTAFGHGWQRSTLYPLLEQHTHGNYLFGLGNHDYVNNLNDCFANLCAYESAMALINRLRPQVDDMDLDIFRSSLPFVDSHGTGSLAYARLVGNYCLIQLNNEPSHHAVIQSDIVRGRNLLRRTLTITPALDWLEGWLAAATQANLNIILNLHQPDRWKGNRQQVERFRTMINRSRVLAVFAGHYHTLAGRFEAPDIYGDVPVFLSGCASQRTYLMAECDARFRQLTIHLVRDNDPRRLETLHTILLDKHE